MLRKADFTPEPLSLMNIISEVFKSEVKAGFIHGSYVSANGTLICSTYRERMYYEDGEFISSTFYLKNQPPDVDIILIASDPCKLKQLLNEYIVRGNILKELNYFLTLNVMSEEIFANEVTSNNPTAIKRIMKYREILGFGNESILLKAKDEARKFITDLDKEVQDDYDARKNFLKTKLKLGIKRFNFGRLDYLDNFPNYFEQVMIKKVAGFPEKREKIVFPHPMDLKEYIDKKNGIKKFLR